MIYKQSFYKVLYVSTNDVIEILLESLQNVYKPSYSHSLDQQAIQSYLLYTATLYKSPCFNTKSNIAKATHFSVFD